MKQAEKQVTDYTNENYFLGLKDCQTYANEVEKITNDLLGTPTPPALPGEFVIP